MAIGIFTDIATAAIALLIAVVAIYFVLRVMGKIAKFVVTTIILIVVAAVLWMIFSDTGAALPVVGDLGAVFSGFGK